MEKEKSHDEQYAELMGYFAELRIMEENKYVNPNRIEYIMKQIPKLKKALGHYPEVKVPMFALAKNLLLKETTAGHFE